MQQLEEMEFIEFAKNCEFNTFFQTPYWGKLKEYTGWKYYLVGIKENKKIKGEALLLAKKIPILNKYMFYSPRGFLIDFKDEEFVKKFHNELILFIKKNRGIFLKINPYVMYQERDIHGNIVENGVENKNVVSFLEQLGYLHNGFTITYGKDLEPRWISVLDLENEDEESLLKNMRATTRGGILNSYNHCLNLVEIDESRIPEFKELMLHTGERRGFVDRSLDYYKKMYEIFHIDDNIKIMLVELNTKEYICKLKDELLELNSKIEPLKNSTGAKGKRSLKELEKKFSSVNKKISELEKINSEKGDVVTVAGGLFMTFGTQVISLFGASYKEYMNFDGQYFLNFEMIKYALKNGYKKYNFLGITGDFSKDSPMYGLFNFKCGFNAKVVELIGEFTYVVDKFSYFMYRHMFSIYRKLKRLRVKK